MMTDKEKFRADLADLRTDIRCALETGDPDQANYAAKCQREVEALLEYVDRPSAVPRDEWGSFQNTDHAVKRGEMMTEKEAIQKVTEIMGRPPVSLRLDDRLGNVNFEMDLWAFVKLPQLMELSDVFRGPVTISAGWDDKTLGVPILDIWVGNLG